MQKLRQKKIGLLGLVVLVGWTLMAYWPCLQGPFFFDDEHFIQKNKLVHSLDHWPELYTSTVTQGANIKGNFYRPNQQLVYALLHSYYGQSVTWPYHLVPLLLHIGTGLMLYFWLRRLQLATQGAVVGTVLFLIHPVQTEAVCYISGLSDPLATFFVMLSLLLMSNVSGPEQGQDQPLAKTIVTGLAIIGSILAALFSKESAVVIAPCLGLYLFATCLQQKRKPSRAEWLLIAVAIVLAAASVVLKFTVFRFGDAAGLTDAANPYTESLQLRLTTFIAVIWDYVKLIFWPYDLHYEKPYTAYEGFAHARGVFGLCVALLAMVPLILFRKLPRVALGVGVVIVAMAPFSGVIPLNAMFLEHWLYTAMLGFSLLLALLVDKLWSASPKLRPLLTLLVVVLAGLATMRTMTRAHEWADVEAFYLNEIAHAKNPGRIYNNLGMYYADRGDRVQAIKYYKLAADSDTGKMFAQPHHNLAMAYLAEGRQQEALAALRAALAVDHQFIYSLNTLNNYFVGIGDLQRAGHVASAIRTVNSGQSYDFNQFDHSIFGP